MNEAHGKLLRLAESRGYRVGRRLGAGASSVVHAGEGPDGPVALKLFVSVDEGLRRRFAREGGLALRLRHPHLVAARDLIEQGELALLVMERVEGQTLATRLTRGPLPERELLATLAQLSGALAYAHSQGIVHRDVKPANVLLGPRGALLCDLGLARDAMASSLITGTSDWVGTCEYLAPEQVLEQPLGAPVDVFSLGATAYHAACGSLPFPATDLLSLAREIAYDEPRSLRRLRADLSRGVVTLIASMLTKSPAARPSAAAVRDESLRLGARPCRD